MTLRGWPSPFKQRPWGEIAAFFSEMADLHPHFWHMVNIVDSVVESGTADQLAAVTSMHDLVVVPLPLLDPPYDVVAVRAPSSLHRPKDGLVIIEHLTCTGHDDRIERPVEEAVPLFWRFMIEKYGVHPVHPPRGA